MTLGHMAKLMIGERVQNQTMITNTIFIFYDVEVTASKEIEQLVAGASIGEHFSTFIRTEEQ